MLDGIRLIAFAALLVALSPPAAAQLPDPALTPDPLTLSGPIGGTDSGNLTLANNGAAALENISLPGSVGIFSVTGHDCPSSLPGGNSCSISIECTVPSAAVTETYTVNFDEFGAPATSSVSAELECAPLLPDPALTPDPLTLAAPVGETDSGDLTLANTGDGPLTNLSLPGSAGIFGLTGHDCPSTLPAGNDCTLTIECTAPASPDMETYTATFDAFGNPATSSVSAELVCEPLLAKAPTLPPWGFAALASLLVLLGLLRRHRAA